LKRTFWKELASQPKKPSFDTHEKNLDALNAFMFANRAWGEKLRHLVLGR
jgi:hypothetical protein